jgi:hypothetical protein
METQRPNWCPHNEYIFKAESQNAMCVGKLPNPVRHDKEGEFDFNTHRLCLDTRETGHGIFDLQINKGDAWNLARILKTVI